MHHSQQLDKPDFTKHEAEDHILGVLSQTEGVDASVVKDCRRFGMTWPTIFGILFAPPPTPMDSLSMTLAALKCPCPCPPDQSPQEAAAHAQKAKESQKAFDRACQLEEEERKHEEQEERNEQPRA